MASEALAGRAASPSAAGPASPAGQTSSFDKRKIKVVQVIPTLDRSGAEKQLQLLCAGLPKERFDVHVVALTRGGPYQAALEAAGVPVTVLKKRFKLDPTTLFRLTGEIRKLAPDIVHTWLFAANAYGRVAARWAGVPILLASERCVDKWKSRWQFAIDRWLLRWTSAVVVNSRAVAHFYAKVGVPANQIHVIPNAIEPLAGELADKGWRARARQAVRRELELPADKPVLGFFGRLWPQKRVQDLIWALDVLRLSGWDTPLIVAGEGPRHAALVRFARSIAIDQQIRFLGHRGDIDRLLSAIDILVLPSKFEGMPNVVLEAMRAGIPVVATSIAGMEEVVVDEVTGILVEPMKPFALAKAINRLLVDRDLASSLGAAGQERATRDFSTEKMVANYADLYGRLIGEKDKLDQKQTAAKL